MRGIYTRFTKTVWVANCGGVHAIQASKTQIERWVTIMKCHWMIYEFPDKAVKERFIGECKARDQNWKMLLKNLMADYLAEAEKQRKG